MTIAATDSEISYSTDGITATFDIPFQFDTASDLKVVRTDSSGNAAEITTGFSIAGGGGGLGTITFSPVLASGYSITISDDLEFTQDHDYTDNDPFPAESHERALDRVVRMSKRLSQQVKRALRFADGDPSTDGLLESVENRKGRYLYFNAVTGALEYAANLALTTLTQAIIGALLNPQSAAEIAAGVTPTSKQYAVGHVFRYMTSAQIADVSARTRTLDVTAAITTALSCNYFVFCPDGDYRTDTTVTVPSGKMLQLTQGASLVRVAAASATTPVVYLQGYRAALDGGLVITAKNSPGGAIACGHLDNTTNLVSTNWRLTNVRVEGVSASGNIGILVPSGEATLGATAPNYFGFISRVVISRFDRGLRFTELANAHFVTDVEYEHCRTACLELRGAAENSIKGQFFHQGDVNGLISVLISNKTVGSQESQFNVIDGIVSETGGVADVTVSIQSNAVRNRVCGADNNAGGFVVANLNNYVELNGIVRYCQDMQLDAVEVYGKSIYGSSRNFGGVVVSRFGFTKSYNSANGVSLGVGSDFTIPDAIGAGTIQIRNASDGGYAVVVFDSATGCTVLSGTVVVAGADPGAGAGKFWISNTGTSVFIRNRYVANKAYDILVSAVS